MGTRRPGPLAAAAATALLVLAAAVLLSLRAPERAAPPLRPAEATRVADAARAAVATVAVGESTRVAVLAGAGVALTGPPPPTPTPTPRPELVGEGTPAPDITAVPETPPTPGLLVDPGRGIAAVPVPGPAGPALRLGRSDDLRPGDQVVFASGAADPLVVRFAGRATVRLGSSILSQELLDLELPAQGGIAQGAVLDRDGRLLGVVVPERQDAAPPGHVYAVPVEQAADLLNRIGARPG
jgi:hypothetical protein